MGAQCCCHICWGAGRLWQTAAGVGDVVSSAPVCVSPADCFCHRAARARMCKANTLVLKFRKGSCMVWEGGERRGESKRLDNPHGESVGKNRM